MTYTAQTPIKGLARGDPDRIADWAYERGAYRPDFLAAYLAMIYHLAPELGINADIVAAQSHLETDGWRSHWWKERGNPGGIGITGDPAQNAASHTFATGDEAAIAHVAHLGLYVGADVPPDWAQLDPRWDAAIAAGYRGIATTLEDLNGRWAVDPDNNYHGKIAARLNLMDSAGLLMEPSPQGDGMEDAPMAKPTIVLVAGHRSVGDRGNPTERELTDDLARAYDTAFTAAGFPVVWVNPTLYPGGLDGLALATGRAIKAAIDKGAKLVLMLDLHFNGARSGVHAIVPHNLRQDGRGMLSSGYVQGRVPGDLATNNTLDVRVAAAIASEIAGIPGMTLWRANRSGVNGVMLENETGVGNNDGNPPDNARLAMMAATAPYQANAVRLTVEHGGTDDASKPDFFNRCAQAALRAVSTTLADRIDDGTGGGQPEPQPDPEPEAPPTGDPGGPSLPVVLFGEAGGFSFDPDGPVTTLWLARGKETGRWPRLIDVKVDGAVKWFIWSDGSVIRAEGATVAYVDDIAA
jgi:hypothetical protein